MSLIDIFREYAVDPLERFLVKDVFKLGDPASTERPGPKVFMEETCRVAADRMAEYDVAHLKVFSHGDPLEKGTVSLNDLLKARRFHFLEESHRETMFPIAKGVSSI